MIKKVFVSLILSCFVFVSLATYFTPRANAQIFGQGPWYSQGVAQFYDKVYGDGQSQAEIFGERYTAAQVNWIINTLLTFPMTAAFGPDITLCLINLIFGGGIFGLNVCLGPIIGTQAQPAQQLAVPPPVDNSLKALIGAVFAERGFSGVNQVKIVANKLNPARVAHAQVEGFGYTRLQIVETFWVQSRNTAYGLMVFATIIAALMIMLRMKISAQAVITVQSALPKIVLSLILITFSFAIAGFLVDLMYVAIGFISLIINPNRAVETFSWLTTGPKIGSVDSGIFGITVSFVFKLFFGLMVASFNIDTGLGHVLGLDVGGAVNGVISALVIIILFIIMLAALIYAVWISLKVILALVKATVTILLLTMFSPFAALAGAIPGVGYGFGQWTKSFISNLAVFPTVGLLVLLANMFLEEALSNSGVTSLPLVGTITPITSGFNSTNTFTSGWPPLLGVTSVVAGEGVDILWILMSIGLMNMTPKAADVAKSLMAGKAEFGGLGAAVGFIGAGTGFVAGRAGDWRSERFQRREVTAAKTAYQEEKIKSQPDPEKLAKLEEEIRRRERGAQFRRNLGKGKPFG